MITNLFLFAYFTALLACLVIAYTAGRKKSKYIVTELSKVDISKEEKQRIAREIISSVYPELFGKKLLLLISGFLAESEYKKFKSK
jgi:hypothetical protein